MPGLPCSLPSSNSLRVLGCQTFSCDAKCDMPFCDQHHVVSVVRIGEVEEEGQGAG